MTNTSTIYHLPFTIYMKKLLFIISLASVIMTACFKDETTLATLPLAEIVLDTTSMQRVYYISKNDTLRIQPKFSQPGKQLEVSTQWEVNQEKVSEEPVLEYVGTELGTFSSRLILSNTDGRTFYTFTIEVVTPYEEGIALLSHDEEGKSYLSFMLTPTDPSAPRSFTTYDCFAMNNDGEQMASHAVDMLQSSGSLMIACQGAENWQSAYAADRSFKDVPTIYYLNEKTLLVENSVPVTEYEDFKPTHMVIPSEGASGVAYPVLCENGSIYEFSTTEGAIAKPTRFQHKYAQTCAVHDSGSGWSFELMFWDKGVGDLCILYSGYGPYYCGKKYHLTREECDNENNYFVNQNIVKIVPITLTAAQQRTDNAEVLVITQNSFATRKTILDFGFWDHNYQTGENYLADNGGTTLASAGVNLIKETTPCVANKTFYSMLFGKGNKVMRWNYTTTQTLANASVLTSVGSENAIITDLIQSKDHLTTYVAFYEPLQSGLNGSVYVIDTDNGAILERYENVCYKPTRIIYKKK